MTEESFTPAVEQARDRSLPDDLRSLGENARRFAEAEIAYQKTRASYTAGQVKIIAICGAVALVLAWFTLMGLVFGLILALAPHLTAWGSMALVCGLLLLATLICAGMALSRWRRMSTALAGRNSG